MFSFVTIDLIFTILGLVTSRFMNISFSIYYLIPLVLSRYPFFVRFYFLFLHSYIFFVNLLFNLVILLFMYFTGSYFHLPLLDYQLYAFFSLTFLSI